MEKFNAFYERYRRRMIQIVAAVAYNLNLKGFRMGAISKEMSKAICVPGLNCYSCPGAIGACPLGSLQAALGNMRFKLPLYLLGTLLLFGIFLGRAICAFLCPIGLLQELLYKIPSKKLKKNKWTRRLSYLKYGILTVFVLGIPLYYTIAQGVAVPAFCKFICPAGTLEGGVPLVGLNESLRNTIGWLFNWKMFLLVLFLVSSVFIYRPFCRFLCPLGAIYSFFNKTAIVGIRVDQSKCIHCGLCAAACKMDVRHVNDHECIRCGECKAVCPVSAITTTTKERKDSKQCQKFLVKTKPDDQKHKGKGLVIRRMICVVLTVVVLSGAFYVCNFRLPFDKRSLSAGDIAPDFSMTLTTGEIVSLSDYRGKTVLIDFWATWCHPCVAGLPNVQSLHDQYPNELIVLAVNASESLETCSAFAHEKGYTFPMAQCDESVFKQLYPSTGIPYKLLISKEGVIVFSQFGGGETQEHVLAAEVKSAIIEARRNEPALPTPS